MSDREQTQNLTELKRISFNYQDAPETIHEVTLKVKPGECVVLCGMSGSGKTTLVRLVNGLAGGFYPGSYTGHIALKGKDAKEYAIWKRADYIGSVFQEPAAQFFSSELPGEIAFTIENLGTEHARIIECTDELISHFRLDHLRERRIDTLSSGEKQKVAIASACINQPELLCMDEPSSNLDEAATKQLGKTLLGIKQQGISLLIAEHRIAYLMDVADRFCIVFDGRIFTELTADQMRSYPAEKREAFGLRNPVYLERPKLPDINANPTTSTLELRDVSIAYGKHKIVAHQSFSVASGMIAALVGNNGCGKTTLCRALAGLIKIQTGRILINGHEASRAKRRRLVWFTPNDVRSEFVTSSVAEEIMLLVEPSEQQSIRTQGT